MEITRLHRVEHPVNIPPKNPEYLGAQKPTPRSPDDRRKGMPTRRVEKRTITLSGTPTPKRRWRYDRRNEEERRTVE